MNIVTPNPVLLSMLAANMYTPVNQMEQQVLIGVQLQVCSDFITEQTQRLGSLAIPAMQTFFSENLGMFTRVAVDMDNGKIRLFNANSMDDVLIGKELHLTEYSATIYKLGTLFGARTFEPEKTYEYF